MLLDRCITLLNQQTLYLRNQLHKAYRTTSTQPFTKPTNAMCVLYWIHYNKCGCDIGRAADRCPTRAGNPWFCPKKTNLYEPLGDQCCSSFCCRELVKKRFKALLKNVQEENPQLGWKVRLEKELAPALDIHNMCKFDLEGKPAVRGGWRQGKEDKKVKKAPQISTSGLGRRRTSFYDGKDAKGRPLAVDSSATSSAGQKRSQSLDSTRSLPPDPQRRGYTSDHEGSGLRGTSERV